MAKKGGNSGGNGGDMPPPAPRTKRKDKQAEKKQLINLGENVITARKFQQEGAVALRKSCSALIENLSGDLHGFAILMLTDENLRMWDVKTVGPEATENIIEFMQALSGKLRKDFIASEK